MKNINNKNTNNKNNDKNKFVLDRFFFASNLGDLINIIFRINKDN